MKQIIIKTLLGIVVALCSLNANAQVKAFEKYADTKNVTYVYISKYMLGMAGKNATPSVPGVDIKTLAGKLTGIQIVSTENKAAQAKLKNDAKSIMAKDKYELLMQMKEDDSKVNIYHHIAKQQSAVVMQVEDNEELTLMIFSGKFTLEDVMKMAH
jgi:thioredoxin-related protein